MDNNEFKDITPEKEMMAKLADVWNSYVEYYRYFNRDQEAIYGIHAKDVNDGELIDFNKGIHDLQRIIITHAARKRVPDLF